MLNKKAMLLAVLLYMAMPANFKNTVDNNTLHCVQKSWWPMLYPELCGNGSNINLDDSNVTVTLKIWEILKK